MPGVGPITVLAFATAIDDPDCFERSTSVGAYRGLTSRRFQSSDSDWSGRISNHGDALARHMLYQAANVLMSRVRNWSAPKARVANKAKARGGKRAHVGSIVDASMPTYLLTHWARDRASGGRIPLEAAVKMQTADTAAFFGIHDRGRLAPGLRADVNLIDYKGLRLRVPTLVRDLPAGGQRLMQTADG